MYAIQNLMERLRPLVGSRGWDYCVLWKVNQDQSMIECMDCCCGGGDQYLQQGVEEINFTVSPICKDALFPHERSYACELLAQLQLSIPLDSGIYAHTLLSNHPRWLNFASCSELNIREDTVGTKVLIPIPGGLIELFVAKQVPEDPQIVEFITAHCTSVVSMEGASSDAPGLGNFSMTNTEEELENMKLQQHDLFLPTRHSSSGLLQEVENDASEISIMDLDNTHIEFVEPLPNMKLQGINSGSDKDVLRRGGRLGSVSENEGEEQENEKKPQSKNLVAERRRRKKLNDHLYALRALVPRISKLDRASIIGDAIEFIKDMENQQKVLQDELEELSDVEDHHGTATAINQGSKRKFCNGNIDHHPMMNPHRPPYSELLPTNTERTEHNKPQQMEPQVEVNQIDGKEFFVKVFCEHKAGGFVRLMEALDSIGLEVKNANITSFRSLVSSIFTVEKKDSDLIQADHVKDSLLEVTRNVPPGGGEAVAWPTRGGGGSDVNTSGGELLLADPNHRHHYPILHNHPIY